MATKNGEGNTVILMAEDNPADQRLAQRVFGQTQATQKLFIVEDGEEVLKFLRNDSPYSNPQRFPRPDILLLDINMPRMNGIQVLEEIRRDSQLRLLPVVMLTTSSSEKDIQDCYHRGVNAYIAKPGDFKKFQEVVETLRFFWLNIASLPNGQN